MFQVKSAVNQQSFYQITYYLYGPLNWIEWGLQTVVAISY